MIITVAIKSSHVLLSSNLIIMKTYLFNLVRNSLSFKQNRKCKCCVKSKQDKWIILVRGLLYKVKVKVGKCKRMVRKLEQQEGIGVMWGVIHHTTEILPVGAQAASLCLCFLPLRSYDPHTIPFVVLVASCHPIHQFH